MLPFTNPCRLASTVVNLRRTALALMIASAVTAHTHAGLPTVELTPVTGGPDMLQPSASIANLGEQDYVAGRTWWDNDGDGIFFIETFVGFLWTPDAGSTVFEIPASMYWNDNIIFPNDIADNGVVVGGQLFMLAFQSNPFRWTAETGFHVLPMPAPGWAGGAQATSADGFVSVGIGAESIFSTQFQPLVWKGNGTVEILPHTDLVGQAWDIDDTGNVIVGDTGSDLAHTHAARWVESVESPLDVVPDSTFSTARFVSDHGKVAVGYATVKERNVLVLWNRAGRARTFEPPDSKSIDEILAISSDGLTAVGSVSLGGNREPFVWKKGAGFVLIPENGLPDDYDLSTAYDVSDDGDSVVGTLQSTVISNGFPPQTAFLWTRTEGFMSLNDILIANGEIDPDVYEGLAVSDDGKRLLVTGNFELPDSDSNSMIVTLLD